MSLQFSPDEVLELARRLEQQAASFYRDAAMTCSNPEAKELFLDLADMEMRHEQVFDALRDDAHRDPDHWPRQAGKAHWQAVADIMLGKLQGDLGKRFDGKCSYHAILHEAMDFEKDTLVFFVAMKEMLRPGTPQESIDGIIRDEMGHLIELGSRLAGGK